MRRALVAALWATTACAPRVTSDAAGASIVDSAGVSIVTNTAPAWRDGTGWKIDPAPTTVIGADESDPEQQFKYVRSGVLLSNGAIVLITDAGISRFGPDGRFLGRFSSLGDGPGEFRYPATLHQFGGDSIQVGQAEGGIRVAVFTADGKLVREVRADAGRYNALGHWRECAVGVFPDGSTHNCQDDPTIPHSATNRPNRLIGEGMTSPGPGRLRQLNRIFLVPPALDTAYPLSIGSGIEQFGVPLQGGQEVFIRHPFYSFTRLAAGGSPMQVAIATNPAYQIEVWSATGKLQRIVRRLGARRAPTPEERQGATASLKQEIARYNLDAVTAEKVLAAIPTPDSMPAIYNLALSPQSDLIVQRDGWLTGQSASHFDVVDAAGRWLGEFTLPRRTRILQVGSDFLLVHRVDDSDLPRVEVYHLTRN